MPIRKRVWRDYIKAETVIAATSTGGPFFIDIGLAQEVDTAFSLTALKAKDIGLATEVNTTFSVTINIGIDISIATEIDSAFSLTVAKTVEIGLASEVNTVFPIFGPKSLAIDLASEVDTAFSQTALKEKAINIASESGTAFSIDYARGDTIGLAQTVVTAFSLSAAKAVSIGIASETNTVFAVSAVLAAARFDFEIDEVQGSTGTQTIAIGHDGQTQQFAFMVASKADAADIESTNGTISVGMTDGTNVTSLRYSAQGNDVQTDEQTGFYYNSAPVSTNRIATITDGGSSSIVEAMEFASLGSEAVNITVLSQSTDTLGQLMTFAGTLGGNGQVAVGKIDNVTGGSTAFANVGFLPDLIFILNPAASSESENLSGGYFGFGMAQSSADMRAYARGSVDNSTVGHSIWAMASFSAVALVWDGSSALSHSLLASNFSSSGFALTDSRTTASTEAYDFSYMALKFSTDSNINVFDTYTSTSTGSVTYTGVGFQADHYLFLGTVLSTFDVEFYSSAGSGTEDVTGFGFGYVDGSSQTTLFTGENNINSTARAATWKIDSALSAYKQSTDGAFTKAYEGSITNFTSDGFTVNFLTADTVERIFLGLALSPASTTTFFEIGYAQEVSQAFAASVNKARAIGEAAEINTAFSFGRLKEIAIGLPQTVDTAFPVTSSGGAGGFSPSDTSGLIFWLDANSSTSITQSSGFVSEWADISGSTEVFSQSVAANQPTWNTTTRNSKPVMSFSDAWMISTDIFIASSTATIMTVFGTWEMQVNFDVFFQLGDNTNRFTVKNRTFPYEYYFFGSFGPDVNDTSSTHWHTFVSRSETGLDGDVFTWQDGGGYYPHSAQGSTSSIEVETSVAYLGNLSTGGDGLDGVIAEFLIYNRALTNSEVDEIGAYLSDKWGTSSTWSSLSTSTHA